MDQIQSFLESSNWKDGDELCKLEVLTKEDIHNRGLLHKSVHLLIIDKENRILCRKRKKDDLRYAGLWTSSIGTHVLLGNNYRSTLLSMLPVNKDIKYIGEFRVHDVWENEVNGLFTMSIKQTKIPKEFLLDRSYISLSELNKLIQDKRTTPHLKNAIELLEKYGII